MKYGIKTLIAAAAIATLPLGAMAQATADPAATPGVDKRQANQEKRITKGVESGALNARETSRLERQQVRIDAAEAHAKADGTVTRQERRRLHHKQTHASRNVYRQKHDRQVAPTGN